MKLAVFGATGPLGLRVLKQALDAQHSVTVLARTPDKLPQEIRDNANLTVVQGDVLNEADCEKTMTDAEAIVVSLGGGTVCSQGQVVVDSAVNKVNADARVVVVTSLGCGESYEKAGFLTRMFVNLVISSAIADKNKQEESVKKDLKNWVLVRPGGLKDGEGTGKYTANEDISGGVVDRADVARFILAECISGDKWRGKGVTVVGA